MQIIISEGSNKKEWESMYVIRKRDIFNTENGLNIEINIDVENISSTNKKLAATDFSTYFDVFYVLRDKVYEYRNCFISIKTESRQSLKYNISSDSEKTITHTKEKIRQLKIDSILED